jgi:hypothetical protein
MRNRRTGYGSKIQEKLEDLLLDHGISGCNGWNIARGWWLSPQANVMRWQCYATYEGRQRQIGSWDSMSDCVRYGISVAPGSEAGGYVDVDVQASSAKNTGSRKVPDVEG